MCLDGQYQRFLGCRRIPTPARLNERLKKVSTNRLKLRLPAQKICYRYAVAMCFAQQFERDLRAILWAADYHRWIDEIVLTEEQRRRFKDFDGFIDKSTCGLLLEKLRGTATISSRKAWKAFGKACEHRNTLAHTFLAEHD